MKDENDSQTNGLDHGIKEPPELMTPTHPMSPFGEHENTPPGATAARLFVDSGPRTPAVFARLIRAFCELNAQIEDPKESYLVELAVSEHITNI